MSATPRLGLSALRFEDGALAAWLAVVAPATTAAGGAALTEGPAAGVLMILASVLAIVCLATRPPDQPGIRLDASEAVAPRWIIAGPLVGGLGIISSTGFEEIGIAGVDLAGLVLLLAVAAIVGNRWLPVVPALVRRLLVLPFMLVAGSFFSGLAAAMLETLDVDAVLATIGTPEWGLTAFILILLVGGLGVFYAMLVVAPRQLADPEDAGVRWLLRFAVFLLASLTGIGWLTLIG
ncbi:MAG TPA: hypothetical protein VF367_01645 [Candidatus Limnocylindria bacterium]